MSTAALTTQTIPGADVQVGDMMTILGQRRAVVRLRDYPADRWKFAMTNGDTRDSEWVRANVAAGARVALLGDGTEMTIVGNSRYTVERAA